LDLPKATVINTALDPNMKVKSGDYKRVEIQKQEGT